MRLRTPHIFRGQPEHGAEPPIVEDEFPTGIVRCQALPHVAHGAFENQISSNVAKNEQCGRRRRQPGEHDREPKAVQKEDGEKPERRRRAYRSPRAKSSHAGLGGK